MKQSSAIEDIALVAPGIGNFGAASFDDNNHLRRQKITARKPTEFRRTTMKF
jgi:hypothetical protein